MLKCKVADDKKRAREAFPPTDITRCTTQLEHLNRDVSVAISI